MQIVITNPRLLRYLGIYPQKQGMKMRVEQPLSLWAKCLWWTLTRTRVVKVSYPCPHCQSRMLFPFHASRREFSPVCHVRACDCCGRTYLGTLDCHFTEVRR